MPVRFHRHTGLRVRHLHRRPHLNLDLPLAPWESALGATVEVPTHAGAVNHKVPAPASTGQKLSLAGRGLTKPRGGAGDLIAVTQIEVPESRERERELYRELAQAANFDPRKHFGEEGA